MNVETIRRRRNNYVGAREVNQQVNPDRTSRAPTGACPNLESIWRGRDDGVGHEMNEETIRRRRNNYVGAREANQQVNPDRNSRAPTGA